MSKVYPFIYAENHEDIEYILLYCSTVSYEGIEVVYIYYE